MKPIVLTIIFGVGWILISIAMLMSVKFLAPGLTFNELVQLGIQQISSCLLYGSFLHYFERLGR